MSFQILRHLNISLSPQNFISSDYKFEVGSRKKCINTYI